MNFLQQTIDNRINIIADRINEIGANIVISITNVFLSIFVVILSVAAIGAVGYILYQCVKLMFFAKQESVQKIIFGYFILLLLRICNVMIGVKIQ